MKKDTVKINDLLTCLSIFLILCVALVRPYLITIFNINGITLWFVIGANVLLLINIILIRKIKIRTKEYIFLSLLLIIVTFYNNAYFQDAKYVEIFIYILSIIYFCLLSLIFSSKRILKYSLIIIILFSIITAIATWVGYLFPDFYRTNIITLLPQESQLYVLKTYRLVNPGLSSHYSRNAFYIVIGIISTFYFYLNSKNKKIILLDAFLLTTLYMIGKRGHLFFLILSFIISYVIYKRISIKRLVKLFGIIVFVILFTLTIIKFVPQSNFVFLRIFESSGDISTGRYVMYQTALELFKNNEYFPIGWGQYAKSTNYTHPALHNDYIQLFIEVGVLGLIIVLGSNLIFLKRSIDYCKKGNRAFGFIVVLYNVFFLTYSITGLPHYDIETYIIYFLFNSILYAFINKKKEV